MLPPPYNPSTTTMGREKSRIARLSISPSNATSGALPAANMISAPATNPAGSESKSEPRSPKYLCILPFLSLPEPTTTTTAVAANLALAAQQLGRLRFGAPLLPQQLAAPLLPQQQRRTIVLARSESDYETDSDDDEDGSWSSEEMSGDEVCGFFFWFLFIEVADLIKERTSSRGEAHSTSPSSPCPSSSAAHRPPHRPNPKKPYTTTPPHAPPNPFHARKSTAPEPKQTRKLSWKKPRLKHRGNETCLRSCLSLRSRIFGGARRGRGAWDC